MSDTIKNEKTIETMVDWLANLFFDPRKKSGFIACELERRLPAQGCSIGIAVNDNLNAIINRSSLPLDKLISLFQGSDSDSSAGVLMDGTMVCILTTSPVQDISFRICLLGAQASIETNRLFIQSVLDRIAQKLEGAQANSSDQAGQN